MDWKHVISLQAVVFLVVCLSSCAPVMTWMANGSGSYGPALISSNELRGIEIGVTTKEEVRSLYGNPSDLQTSAGPQGVREAWAYASVSPLIHPAQYILGLGVFTFLEPEHSLSFSISFSPNGVVEGILIREVQPVEGAGSLLSPPRLASQIEPYGTYNPFVRFAKTKHSD